MDRHRRRLPLRGQRRQRDAPSFAACQGEGGRAVSAGIAVSVLHSLADLDAFALLFYLRLPLACPVPSLSLAAIGRDFLSSPDDCITIHYYS